MIRVLPIEVCKSLRDANFDDPTLHYYFHDGSLSRGEKLYKNSELEFSVSCPAISQVLDWFWYEHEIHITTHILNDKTFEVRMTKFDGVIRKDFSNGPYDTLKDAYIAAIELGISKL